MGYFSSAGVRVTAFVVGLVALFGGAVAAGGAIDPDRPTDEGGGHNMGEVAHAAAPETAESPAHGGGANGHDTLRRRGGRSRPLDRRRDPAPRDHDDPLHRRTHRARALW